MSVQDGDREGVGTCVAVCGEETVTMALSDCVSVELTVKDGVDENVGMASCVEVDEGDGDKP